MKALGHVRVNVHRYVGVVHFSGGDVRPPPGQDGIAGCGSALGRSRPTRGARVLDLGCGTGSLAILLAQQGHRVTGVDLSARMVEVAGDKAAGAGVSVEFAVGDASAPDVDGSFDVVLARHLLWTLLDPHAALRHWVGRLGPGGQLVLVEGRWTQAAGNSYVDGADAMPWTGGVDARTLTAAVRPLVRSVETRPLTDPLLWGRVVDDERYVLLAAVDGVQLNSHSRWS